VTTVRDIYNTIDGFAPFDVIEDGDNVGLLAGCMADEVSGAVISLDVTSAAVEYAVTQGANLIIAHHPVIYKPLYRVDFDSPVAKAIRRGVNIICAHTNIDIAPGGINDILAERIGLADITVMPDTNGLCRVGELPCPKPAHEFARDTAAALNAPYVSYIEGRQPCRNVALVCGGGDFLFVQAAESGIDTFFTGEARHHIKLSAQEKGINLICAGHYYTENIICEKIYGLLKEKHAGLPACIYNSQIDERVVGMTALGHPFIAARIST